MQSATMKRLMSLQGTKDVGAHIFSPGWGRRNGSVGAWPKGAGAWQMRVAERRPFPASSVAENGSKIANRNSLWGRKCYNDSAISSMRTSYARANATGTTVLCM